MLRDVRTVLLVMGLLLCVLGAAMLAPLIADLATGNQDWRAFAEAAAITFFAGAALTLANLGHFEPLSVRGAFLLTAGSWGVLSAFAAAPFYWAALGASPADAFFEAVSGLTTTGSTVLTGLDSMPAGILLWRAILQWMGGIGIIVMALAVLPMLNVGGMQLFRLESSDASDKILPRAREIAGAIAMIYLGLTVACAIAYVFTGMTAFEAVTHAMTTVSTGGYSTSDRSMGAFTQYGSDMVCVAFMILAALPFGLYVLAVRGGVRALLQDDQVRTFLLTVAVLAALLTLYLWVVDIHHPATGLRLAIFNIVSVVTTTGYATGDYTLWGAGAVGFFFCITFLGACAGSTSGGIKIFRFRIGALAARAYLRSVVHPHLARRPHYNGRPVTDAAVFSVLSFFFMFLACFTLVALCLSTLGLDTITAISGAATAIANVGPGLGPIIGPAGTFQPLPDAAKWILSFAMIAGRLEIVTVLVLIAPPFWRD